MWSHYSINRIVFSFNLFLKVEEVEKENIPRFSFEIKSRRKVSFFLFVRIVFERFSQLAKAPIGSQATK